MSDDSDSCGFENESERAWLEEVKKDTLAAIKRTERERGLAFIAILGAATVLFWFYGDQFSNAVRGVVGFFVALSAVMLVEIITVKLLLLKAELRDVVRRLER